MNRAKVGMGPWGLTSAAILLIAGGCSAQPSTGPASPAAGRPERASPAPAGTQPACPLWDGKEPVADYAKRAGIQDVQITLSLGGDVTMKLALIPAGKFMMGSPEGEPDREGDEGPQREVTISKAFYMGACEVTQEQYEQVMGKDPSEFKAPQNPVDTVSWYDAVEFCRRLSRKTDRTVSLPTEAQWEYACRAGSNARFSYGDDADYGELGQYAWYMKNSDGRTHPVGQKKPNALGLYDMQGNVWEWCSDWYADSYANAGTVDPAGPASGSSRVLRGGSFKDYDWRCRSACRCLVPAFVWIHNGFRVAVATGL